MSISRQLTVRAKLSATFGLLVALVLLVSALALHALSATNEGIKLYVNGVETRSWVAEKIRISAAQRVADLADLAAATTPQSVAAAQSRLDTADQALLSALHQLQTMVSPPTDATPYSRSLVAQIAQAEQQYETVGKNIVNAIAQNRHDDAIALINRSGRPMLDNLIKATGDYAGAAQKRSTALLSENAGNFACQRLLLIGVCIAAALVAMVVGTLVTRGIMRALGTEPALLRTIAQQIAHGDLRRVDAANAPAGSVLASMAQMQQSLVQLIGEVRSSGESIATGSRQIATGNLDLSARTEEQASSLAETVAAMDQLTSVVKHNADNAQQASTLAATASDVSRRGRTVVEQVVQTMDEINDSSRKVADITGMIEGIAFQTNILALNAAVEAARAGEQGRGFAVVAGEVRSLAQRASSAAKEISELIGSSVQRIQDGSALAGEAGRTMTEVTQAVARVTDIMGEIAAASSEQSRGIEHVGLAMNQMDEVTQQNAALVEQAAAAAQSMQDQAANLERAVGVFQL
jgi:methyl-accepting chemotaxis protein-1 (serine sensor receptor)